MLRRWRRRRRDQPGLLQRQRLLLHCLQLLARSSGLPLAHRRQEVASPNEIFGCDQAAVVHRVQMKQSARSVNY